MNDYRRGPGIVHGLAARPNLPQLKDYCGHLGETMHEIQLRDAKATLSAVVDQVRRGEPSIITRHGRPEAVVLGFEEWQRLSQVWPTLRSRRRRPSGATWS
jgi:prevent-host-death family protein